tara:strand:+ start:13541 stop:14857 length:1317 start_codon:yes stop_codon:yes gene_type:complete
MSEVKIPEGYKQTEIGVIPEDWLISEMRELTTLMTNGFVGTAKLHYTASSDGVLYIQGYNVKENSFNFNGIKRVTPSFHIKNSKSCLKTGDVLMVQTGDVGMTTVVPPELENSNCHALIINRFKNKLNSTYFSYYFNSMQGRARLKEIEVGTTMKHINVGSLLSFIVPVPPKPEQTAIATTLSDVDNLIQSLEKLIAKKEAIKTGTMQQLLTGKTRLPEFAIRDDGSKKGFKQTELGRIPEDWEVISFDELLEQTISKKSIKPSTLVTFIGMQDVTENAQLANQTIVSYEKLKSGFTYFENGDVLLAKITPCFENGKGCHTETLKTKYGFGSTEFHVLRATEYSDSKFLYFWTIRNSFRIDLESTMVGSAGHRRVPFSAVKNYQIPCPPSKSEQTAIATIISDMDTEIQALHQQLEKTKDVKQGMMQQLLTGKVRLAH